MEPEWFYKPIEGYNRRYIRVGEFRQIRWCESHEVVQHYKDETCLGFPPMSVACVIVDKWLEV